MIQRSGFSATMVALLSLTGLSLAEGNTVIDRTERTEVTVLDEAAPEAPALVTLDASTRSLLTEHDLPVIWKGASFFLALWDDDLQATARDQSVPFEVLATDFDDGRQIYLLEQLDNNAPEAWRDHALYRQGRKWVLEFDPAQAAALIPHGHREVAISRQPLGWNRAAPRIAYGCDYDPLVADLLGRTSQTQWLDWIEKLSGEETVIVGGEESTILTRYSAPMFAGEPHARGFDFVLEQVQAWNYPPLHIEQNPYAVGGQTWKNLILTLPGETDPLGTVVITAHLDSISGSPGSYAPGADDNGTGSAALLEAARLLRQFRFGRTVKIIWFTGEEDGLLGSHAFVDDHFTGGILGVINLDMYGWDSDGDRCHEIHAGTMPASIDVANCFRDSATAYGLGLAHDFLTTGATDRSDHASFWQVDVGAVAISENFFNDGLPNGCVGQDRNPNYHTTADSVDALNGEFGFDVARSALATLAAMAVPLEACFDDVPLLMATPGDAAVALSWTPLPQAATYRVYRSIQGCEGQWLSIGETQATNWLDDTADEARTFHYRVEAVDSDGFCVSALSECASAEPTVYHASTLTAEWTDVCAAGGPGDGNGIVDPGESALISVTLKNDGNADISGISGTLSTLHPDLAIIDPYADWPDISAGGLVQSRSNHFGVQASPEASCGSIAATTIDLTYSEGANATGAFIPIGTTFAMQLLNEDFSGGIPFGWTVVDGGSGGLTAASWTTGNPGGRSIDPPFQPAFAIVDSDAAGSAATQDEQLITPSFNASGCLEVVLEFSNQFNWYSGSQDETGDVDVSLDGGESWTNVLRLSEGDDGYPSPSTKSLDIGALVATDPDDVQIRFRYHQAQNEWWWAIDNVSVECASPLCTPCAGSVGPPGEPGVVEPLTLRREDGELILEWGVAAAGCAVADYAVYKGDLANLAGSGYSHDVVLTCSSGSASFSLSETDPRIGAADYYLVVAGNGLQEGSYGRSSAGSERPSSVVACHVPQNLADCEP